MRTVGLQSRFQQIVGEETVDRRTVSVVKPVTGDAVRRAIVDPAKCANCHEWLALHGGSRVVAATTAGDPAENGEAILGARDAVPSGTDLVNTPTTATCFQCHDSAAAVAHMELGGGQINVFLREEPVVGADFVGVGADVLTRDEVLASGMTESCVVCHGSGRIADLNLVHGIE